MLRNIDINIADERDPCTLTMPRSSDYWENNRERKFQESEIKKNKCTVIDIDQLIEDCSWSRCSSSFSGFSSSSSSNSINSIHSVCHSNELANSLRESQNTVNLENDYNNPGSISAPINDSNINRKVMYKDINLLSLTGNASDLMTPSRYGCLIARTIWPDLSYLVRFAIPHPDSKQTRYASNDRMNFTDKEDLIKTQLIKEAVMIKFQVDPEDVYEVWLRVRASINQIGNRKMRTIRDKQNQTIFQKQIKRSVDKPIVMYRNTNLLDITPKTGLVRSLTHFAILVAKFLWPRNIFLKYKIFTQLNRIENPTRIPFSKKEDLKKINLIKKAIRIKYNVEPAEMESFWTKARNAINHGCKPIKQSK